MSVLVRAGDVPATSRTDYWQHVVETTLGPLEVLRPPGGLDGRDRLLVGEAGAVRVAELTSGRPGGARRTAAHVRRSDLGLCKVDVLASGRGVVVQDGREAPLARGDLTLVDLSRPASWRMSAMRVVAVVFPRALLPLPPGDVAGLTAVRVPGDQGTGALVSSLSRQLVGRLDDWSVAEGARLGTTVLDLLTVALAARLEREEQVPPDLGRRALLHRIHAFIEQRLGDPELTPAMIAAAHHVSLRYLYKLFEAQEQSVAGWVRRRRLERCRRDLLDPALAARPVSAIGARWGLVNAAHFSRAFRAAYGLSPAEYRAMAAGSSPSVTAAPS
jgi:AraC-like DNA-binding protein